MALPTRLPARFTLAHGLMILTGLLTFVLVNSALADRRETATVYLATERAVAGQPMTPVAAQVALDTPGLELFATRAQLEEMVLARSLPAGQPIMSSDLVKGGDVRFRTIALPVDSYQITGLALDRNDRVDVVGFDGDDTPLYLATDLVVEATSSASSEGLGGLSDTYITVRVNDVQALQLSKGQLNGPLQLVRSTGAAPITEILMGAAPEVVDESAGVEAP
ncbi:MAG: hypothetical protein HKN24_13580 [Acidimicrobiales bacterium]|nr:hypothetical protein [Acidimicrobiales bacterium]